MTTVSDIPPSPPEYQPIDSTAEADAVRSLPWRSMDDFPRDGTICAVMYYPWNVKTSDPRIQLAQWLDLYGSGGKLYEPWNANSEPLAEGWLPLAELTSLNAARQVGAND